MRVQSLFFLVLTAFLLYGCWPSSISFKDSGSMDERWQQFYVSTIQNEAANASLSYPATLTEDLKDGIQNNTRLKLGTDKEAAQLIIDGTIINYSVSPAAIQQGDQAAKSRLTISVKFDIDINVPKKQGELSVDDMQMTSTRFMDYDANQDFTSVEQSLIEEINKQIVQDVVNKLMSNW